MRTSSTDFEAGLLDADVDYVIACHPPRDPAVAHKRVVQERWIAIGPAAWTKELKSASPDRVIGLLRSKPFIRHSAINPAEAVGGFVEPRDAGVWVDSLIGVRAAVLAGHGWSCVPELAVRAQLAEGSLAELKVPVRLEGMLCVWWLRARSDSGKNIQAITQWLHSACVGATAC